MADSRKPGRKPRMASQGRRASLGLKVTPEIKNRLDAAAKLNGRTQSQEAEARLENSFLNETTFWQVLELLYGKRVAGILTLLGRVLIDVGPVVAYQKTGDYAASVNWASNAAAFDQAAKGIATVLDSLRPEGDAAPPPGADRIGEFLARGALVAVKDREAGGELGDWARPVRERLGEIVDRIKADPRDGLAVNALPLGERVGEFRSRVVDTHLGRSLLEGDDH